MHKVAGRPLVVLITIASSCGFILFGYDNGVFAGVLVLPWFLNEFGRPNSKLLGTISAMYNIGGFLGGTIAFFIGARLGRRRTILTGMVICAVGAILQSAATKLGELIAGRITCGIGVGVMTSTVGLWQAEIVGARSRGMYLTLQVLCGGSIGLLLAQWINYGFHQNTGRIAFIFPLAFQLIFVLAGTFLILILPESPRWLVKQDRQQEAREILLRLEGKEETVERRLRQIDEACTLERSAGGGQFRQMFSNGPTQNLRRVCLACGTMIMHQLNGVNSVTYYMPTLLIKFAKVSHGTALWVAGLTSITAMLFATIPVMTIDRMGRRPFLYAGSVIQSVLFIIIAVLLATNSPASEASHKTSIAIIAMFFLFYGVNAASWLGASWAYPAEILPLQIREKGLALGNICYWLFQFMIVEITPIALTNIYYRFYIILAVFNAANAVIIYFWFPETKGLSLEEIDFFFARKYAGSYGAAEECIAAEEKSEPQHGVDTFIENSRTAAIKDRGVVAA